MTLRSFVVLSAIVVIATCLDGALAGVVGAPASAPAGARPTYDEYKEQQAAKKAEEDEAEAKASKMGAVNKVITMLTDLKSSVLAEGEKEAASYNKFACFCKDTQAEKAKAISDGTNEKEVIAATIGQLASDRDTLDTTIADLETDIEGLEGEMKTAKDERNTTLVEYIRNEADLGGAVKALENAIGALKASRPTLVQFQAIAKTVQSAALMADALGLKSAKKSNAILLQQAPDVEMEAYKFRSNDVIDTLEGLLKDFKEQKAEVDAAEVQSVQEYQLLMQEKTDALAAKNKQLEKAQADKAAKQEEIAINSQQLSTVAAQLLADQQYAKELAQMCSNKATTWDQRSQVRSDEIQALTSALNIIKGAVSETTSGSTMRLTQQGVSVALAKQFAKDSDSMVDLEAETEDFEAEKSTAFLQKRQVTLHTPASKDGRLEIISLLKNKGKQLKSQVLVALAGQIEAAKEDPFAKVKTLIQELIERLQQEAANEATQKEWCDKAISDAEQKRDTAAEEIRALNSKIATLEARIDGLKQDIAKLTEEITDLENKKQEAIDMRAKEQAENQATVDEANAGLSAVQQAISLLKDFYSSAGAPAASFAQKQSPGSDAPNAGFDGEYKGKVSEAGGVIGMLEVIEGDFQRTVTETEKAESEAEEDHQIFLTETDKVLAEKNEAKTALTTQKDEAEEELNTDMGSLDSETATLQSALQELLELQPACIDTGMSYQDRVDNRAQEIAALKQALCILSAYAEYGASFTSDQC